MKGNGKVKTELRARLQWADGATVDAIAAEMKEIDGDFRERILDRGYALYEESPRVAIVYFLASREASRSMDVADLAQWVELGTDICRRDRDCAVAYFRSSPQVLKLAGMAGLKTCVEMGGRLMNYPWLVEAEYYRSLPRLVETMSLDGLSRWIDRGIELSGDSGERAASYFALASQAAREGAKEMEEGMALADIHRTLTLYVQALCGRQISIRPGTSIDTLLANCLSREEPKLYLPPAIDLFADNRENFNAYLIKAAHEAAHFEFGTYDFSLDRISETIKLLEGRYARSRESDGLPGILGFLSLFPHIDLALYLFQVIEDGRTNDRLRRNYPGLRRYMDYLWLESDQEWSARFIDSEMVTAVHLLEELIATGTMHTGAAPGFDLVDTAYGIFLDTIAPAGSTVEQSAGITAGIYLLFDDYFREPVHRPPGAGTTAYTVERLLSFLQDRQTAHPAAERDGPAPAADEPGERLEEVPAEDPNLQVYRYREWDDWIGDYRVDWCTLREYILPSGGGGDFVETTLAGHASAIASMKRQFELFRRDLEKVKRQEDGEDIDIEAAIESFIDRKMGQPASDKVYIHKMKRTRSLSTVLLLDMSVSTRKVVQASGGRIIDFEKEGMVLLMEALGELSDECALYGFSSRGRDHVYFYRLKDFEEDYDDAVRQRICAVAPVANTRLGTAVRHATVKLHERDSRTKLLILLTDGKPCDYDYRDRYAQEDTRMALEESRARGVHTFCITLDGEGKDFLSRVYAHNRYVVIDDSRTLPEKVPYIYGCLTA